MHYPAVSPPITYLIWCENPEKYTDSDGVHDLRKCSLLLWNGAFCEKGSGDRYGWSDPAGCAGSGQGLCEEYMRGGSSGISVMCNV